MPFYTLLKTTLPRALPWVIALVFLSLIAWQVVPMFMDTTEISANTTSAPESDPRLQQIIAGEIFGVLNEANTEQSSTETVTTNTEPQITSLPYILKGIISAASPEKGSAIIEIAPGDSRYFSAGREISNNVKLVAVHNDHVTINNQGQQEILRLTELSLSMTNPATPSSSFGEPLNSDTLNNSPTIPSRDDNNSDIPENNLDSEDMLKRDRIRQRLEELRARNPS